MSEFKEKLVHINDIKPGDTVKHDGEMKTVSKININRGGFMGTSIFGDSYMSGNKMVVRLDYMNEAGA